MIDKKYTITTLKERHLTPGTEHFYVNYDSISMYPHRLPKTKVADMTEAEQADEIINRLKAPPVSKYDLDLEEEIYTEITKVIDQEILNSLTHYGRKNFGT